MNDYAIGQFGKATFICKKGWKAETICYGRITAIESKIVEFTDNDENEYLIPRNKFKFEPEEFKAINK